MTHLLDTNTVIRLLAGDRAVSAELQRHSKADIVVSSIVMFELTFGALKGARVNDNIALLANLRLTVAEFDLADAHCAAEMRLLLQRAGTPIGPYDVLIAGQARARDLALVTHNTREFSRVPGLRLEDWEA